MESSGINALGVNALWCRCECGAYVCVLGGRGGRPYDGGTLVWVSRVSNTVEILGHTVSSS